MLDFVMILICVVLGVGGQLLMKQGTNQVGAINFAQPVAFLISAFTNLYVLAGFVLYFLSSILWIVALSRVELSFAYPLISIGYVIVLIMSGILFKEKVLPIHWAGVLLIMAGVVLITRGR